MEEQGQRILNDRAKADQLICEAKEHEKLARLKWAEALEIERLLELATRVTRRTG
ncbi:hypothetical protein NLM27_08890 [Bradyrhizobium sp. CCGB12]|uniref:hypothetical protein n=1 Tax=Bradyrhizobium sp. CCGB12 TaxID=2949632 RepID=UPI0020B2117F|nr:hypothetical protein [Bradyrhizobium sp. CCGB12]MCP3388888.1 hypothetical protein [Bradyrhizobium sp. CCGB12]